MRQIDTEADWYDALDETGPFNRPRLQELVGVAEDKGWSHLERELLEDIKTLDAMDELAARQGHAWSRFQPPPGGFRWGVFGRKLLIVKRS